MGDLKFDFLSEKVNNIVSDKCRSYKYSLGHCHMATSQLEYQFQTYIMVRMIKFSILVEVPMVPEY